MCVQGPERRVAFFTGTLTLTLLLCDACDFTCDLHVLTWNDWVLGAHSASVSHSHSNRNLLR